VKYLLLILAVALLASVPAGTVQAQCSDGQCAVAAQGPLLKVAVAAKATVKVALAVPVKVAARVADRIQARPLIRRARARIHARPLIRGFRDRLRRCR